MEEPRLYKASLTFTQEANCLSESGDHEEITIELVSDLWPEKENHFFVVKTEGWSVDSEDEFKQLFERCKSVL